MSEVDVRGTTVYTAEFTTQMSTACLNDAFPKNCEQDFGIGCGPDPTKCRVGECRNLSLSLLRHFEAKEEVNAEEHTNIMGALNETQAKVTAVLTIVQDYELQVNAICVICGAMFITLGRFGFMARHIGMVTVKSVCTSSSWRPICLAWSPVGTARVLLDI